MMKLMTETRNLSGKGEKKKEKHKRRRPLLTFIKNAGFAKVFNIVHIQSNISHNLYSQARSFNLSV